MERFVDLLAAPSLSLSRTCLPPPPLATPPRLAIPPPPTWETVTWPKKHRKHEALKASKKFSLGHTRIRGRPSFGDRLPSPPWETVTRQGGRLQGGAGYVSPDHVHSLLQLCSLFTDPHRAPHRLTGDLSVTTAYAPSLHYTCALVAVLSCWRSAVADRHRMPLRRVQEVSGLQEDGLECNSAACFAA